MRRGTFITKLPFKSVRSKYKILQQNDLTSFLEELTDTREKIPCSVSCFGRIASVLSFDAIILLLLLDWDVSAGKAVPDFPPLR